MVISSSIFALLFVAAGTDGGTAADAMAETAAPSAAEAAPVNDAVVDDPAALPSEPVLVFPTVDRLQWAVGAEEAELLLLLTTEPARALATAQRAQIELTRVYGALDASDDRTELRRLERAGGEPLALSPDVFDALHEALRVSRLSSGAYDPTAAPLLELWGFEGRGGVPEPEPLKQALTAVDFHRLSLDEAEHTAVLQPGSQIALGPLRRGAALERAARVLERAGMQHFVLRCGGDIVVRGAKGGKPWMVGVQDPRGQGYFAAFPASDQAVATVGDYDRYFFRAGVRFHSVLDPRTGVPARRVRSATVMAERADFAAALAYAVFVLGAEAGLELVGRLRNVETIIIDENNRVHLSAGLADVVRYRPPTDGV